MLCYGILYLGAYFYAILCENIHFYIPLCDETLIMSFTRTHVGKLKCYAILHGGMLLDMLQ